MSEEPESETSVMRAMHEAAERHEMRLEEFKHSLQRLWDELDEDQLQTLSTMMHILAYSPGSRKTAAQWEGAVCTYLKFRFGICITCGVNHDKEIQTDAPSAINQEPEMKETDDETLFFDKTEFSPLSFTKKQQEQMYLYHLDDCYEDGTNKFLGFKCTGINGAREGCGLIYPTLEDRMMKEPENCHGCYERMAHG